MKAKQDRYKSYTNQHRKDKEFSVGDHVLLKVSPIQGLVRFRQKRGKLSPLYIRSLILEYVGKVAYRLVLLLRLSRVHNVFYVSMLKKYQQGPMSHVIDFNGIEVNDNVSYLEKLVRILDRETRSYRARRSHW